MSDPTLVYDDDCGFCTWWANYVAQRSDIRLIGFSELSEEMRDRLPADYEECSHLVTDDEVYSCGASIEESLVRLDRTTDFRPLAKFLRQFDEYTQLRERLYRKGADHRGLLGTVFSADSPDTQHLDTDD